MQQFRDQVKTIDLEIVYLLSRRLENVKQIGLLKKELDLDVIQNDKWNELLWEVLAESRERMMDDDFIVNIWNLIHQESKKVQK